MPVEDRLKKFKERAVPLVTEVCAQAIKDAGLEPGDIEKLVVVSSTGFIGPGLDCELIQVREQRLHTPHLSCARPGTCDGRGGGRA